MSKPLEEKWEARSNYVEFRSGAKYVGHADIHSELGERDAHARMDFIAAAPDMAQALLAVVYRQGDSETRGRDARDALRKAGLSL